MEQFFKAEIDIEQKSALFSILSAFYITFIFYIFKKRSKNLLSNIPFSFLSFVDNGFFFLQEKIYKKSNIFLFCSYNIISFLFDQVRLTIEHGKSEVFHFFRLTRNFNLSLLDLSLLESPIL